MSRPSGFRGSLLSKPNRFTYGIRSMATSSKQRPASVRVYDNSDKEKESIVNENKGRTGIYR